MLKEEVEKKKQEKEYRDFAKSYTDEVTRKVEELFKESEEVEKQIDNLNDRKTSIRENLIKVLDLEGSRYSWYTPNRTDLEVYKSKRRDEVFQNLELDYDKIKSEIQAKLIVNQWDGDPLNSIVNEYTTWGQKDSNPKIEDGSRE